MSNDNFKQKVDQLAKDLTARLKDGDSPSQVLKDPRLKQAFSELGALAGSIRQQAGQALNQLRQTIADYRPDAQDSSDSDQADDLFFDPTAPIDIGQSLPAALPSPELGSIHPISQAMAEAADIFSRMGFEVLESRQIDSEYYMFDSLNFPAGHPARDEFDTFHLTNNDSSGRPLVAPAHTSSMQNRVLKAKKQQLENGRAVAVIVPGRAFRNEDVDTTHDHMFYQLEGIYVDQKVSVANLVATLKEFMQDYYGQTLEVKIQPFYFPFTEPSFELAISCPFCHQKNPDCRICSQGWIEVLGCGSIHPNVLSAAGIDPQKYSGFAWGMGLMRLAMVKHNIEDIRHFVSGRVEFLRQF